MGVPYVLRLVGTQALLVYAFYRHYYALLIKKKICCKEDLISGLEKRKL